MKDILKEPLVHFFILGSIIFVLSSFSSAEKQPVDNTQIVISAGDIERLQATWTKKWSRPPSEQELENLIEAYIREEVYYREALALGLDRNDTVLRRRLMQKMEFLSNDIGALKKPSDSDLQKYYDKHKEKYHQPAQLSFTQVYFNRDKRGVKVFEDAQKALSDIKTTSKKNLDPRGFGDASLIGYDFQRQTPFEISRLFGTEFTEELLTQENNAWYGPIVSGLGIHLVRVEKKIEAKTPDLPTVVEKVRQDWTYDHQQKTNKEIYQKFKAKYEIVIEKDPPSAGTAAVNLPVKKKS